MMPQKPVRDLMRRTMENLAFVESHAASNGPFEVTQLVNSFLGALAHPWETFRQELYQISIAQAVAQGWPRLTKEKATDQDPRNLGDLLRLVRNGLAHGNIEFLPDANNEIHAIRVCNTVPGTGQRTWGSVVTVADMRCFLDRFVELAEQLHKAKPC